MEGSFVFSFISFIFCAILFDIPLLSFVRVILKAYDREKKRPAIVFDKHKIWKVIMKGL